jgi:hypothetical protein
VSEITEVLNRCSSRRASPLAISGSARRSFQWKPSSARRPYAIRGICFAWFSW